MKILYNKIKKKCLMINKKICLISIFVFFLGQTFLYNFEFNTIKVVTINSKSNESLYFSAQNGTLIFEYEQRQFDIIQNSIKEYNIRSRRFNKYIGINIEKKEEIVLYNKKEAEINSLISWNLISIFDENEYIIKNNYNQKYLKLTNQSLRFAEIDKDCINNKTIDKEYIFRILTLYENIRIIKSSDLKIIEKEPIDVFIKYIDLSDNTLKRDGIKQIYKDEDNEELKYSLRSIFEYIPWVRKIFIVMPNERVKFLKSYEEIREKIIYVKDKDFIGFDTANIFAFTFRLFKMKKFGITKNFIYMEDDFFIGKPLKKSDFFYYDRKEKKVLPYILNSNFNELNKNNSLRLYDSLFKEKEQYTYQGGKMWFFSIISTEKYLIEKYNITIINTQFTHNARAENLDDLEDMFKSIQSYRYINETLFSKIRHILTLNQPHYNNLFQLNIKHRKVNSISSAYINMQEASLDKLKYPLFVINTGGDFIPTKIQYYKQKEVMQKRFPFPIKYEIK